MNAKAIRLRKAALILFALIVAGMIISSYLFIPGAARVWRDLLSVKNLVDAAEIIFVVLIFAIILGRTNRRTDREARRRNLIVLFFGNNSSCLEAISPDNPKVDKLGVVIDEEKGVWSAPDMMDPARPRQMRGIGDSRHVPLGAHHGAIGVFDRTNIKDIQLMVQTAVEVARGPGNLLEGD